MKSLHSNVALWLALAVLSVLVAACGKLASDAGTDSSTHWLQRCEDDAACGALRCVCGTCTLPCAEVSACPDNDLFACTDPARVGCTPAADVCVAECSADRDCDGVREGLRCVNGQCESPEPAPGAGGSGGAGGNAGASGSPGASGNAGTSAGSGGGSSCDALPGCEFACPEGTVNPVDSSGCTHTCECVTPGTPPGSLSLFLTCGDPVCSGYTPSGAPLCSTEAPGGACRIEGARCDPQDDCNASLVCASSDPRMAVGGCPISRRDYKADIHYLNADELARVQREVLDMKLATWRYKHDPAKTRLGIIIDDNESSSAVDARRDMVDLYGYTSMVVAALQQQALQIEALQGEVKALKSSCTGPAVNR